ncbi:MAG: DUF2784 domain-containing protein [Pseudomonadota bacterium]
MTTVYAILADVVLVTHAAFVLFVIAGQALILLGWSQGWNWTRNVPFRAAHLFAIGFVAVEAWLGRVCPLTVWETRLRELAGARGYETDFITYWVQRLLFYDFPEWVFTLAYSLFLLLVIITFIAYPPRRKIRS